MLFHQGSFSESPFFSWSKCWLHLYNHLRASSPSAFSYSSCSQINQHALLKDVIDQRIPLPENCVAEGVVSIIKIAFACLLANPQSRPNMRQVASELIARWPPLPKSFSAITLEDLMPQTTVTGWEFFKKNFIISMWLFRLMYFCLLLLGCCHCMCSKWLAPTIDYWQPPLLKKSWSWQPPLLTKELEELPWNAYK